MQDRQALLQRADTLLYQAKQAGRNRYAIEDECAGHAHVGDFRFTDGGARTSMLSLIDEIAD